MTTTSPHNQKRAAAAAAAISAYVLAKSRNQTTPLQSPQEWFIDLLTDLRHHASDAQIDFAAAVRISEDHYKDESSTDV